MIAEPAMTNMGIIRPEAGYHEGCAGSRARTGTLLMIDETHTLSAGPGGCTGAWGLEPDMLSIGKAIAGGVPAGALGLLRMVADAILGDPHADSRTQAASAARWPATPCRWRPRATLRGAHSGGLRARDRDRRRASPAGVRERIARHGLPWHVARLGCRAEYRFTRRHRRATGARANAAPEPELERYLHLHALNRGVMITPFHNMVLMSPQTTAADVDRHTEVFAEARRRALA